MESFNDPELVAVLWGAVEIVIVTKLQRQAGCSKQCHSSRMLNSGWIQIVSLDAYCGTPRLLVNLTLHPSRTPHSNILSIWRGSLLPLEYTYNALIIVYGEGSSRCTQA